MTAKKPSPPKDLLPARREGRARLPRPKTRRGNAGETAPGRCARRGAEGQGRSQAGKVDEKAKKADGRTSTCPTSRPIWKASPKPNVETRSKVKAKPLRMKVSRGEGTRADARVRPRRDALTEEEVAKRRHELKTLIKMGKTRGFLTHQEINDHLPEKLVDHEILEAIVSMLNDMGIAVYEQAPDAATLLIAGGGATTATEEEAEEAAEAALSTVDSEFGRTTDPVRMYMREMGTVELLTREGEIEIAKRIEGGLQAMMLAISASPTTIAEILSYADRIRSGEMKISEAVDGFVSEDEADDYVAEEDVDFFDEEDDDDGNGGRRR